MKKLLYFILVLFMLISFAACKEDEPEEEETPKEPVIEEVTDKEFENWGVFTGTLVDGKPSVGKVVAKGFTYEGTFEDGWLITGTGVLTYEDGTVLEGSFVNKEINGWGKVAYNNGCLGIGYWTDGKLNGDSFFHWPQPNGKYDVYCGPWVDGVRKGVGYYFFSDGTYYHGMFDDWINGLGTMYWTNGNKWTGDFVDGSPKKGSTGFGIMDGQEGWIYVDPETGAWSWGTEPDE